MLKSEGTLVLRLERALTLIEQGKRALAEAMTIDAAKEIRDKAAAVAHYLKQQGVSEEAAQDALELKVRAERRLGHLIKETVSHNGVAGPGRGHKTPSIKEGVLPKGISHKQSHWWQKVASVDDKKFEAYIEKARETGQEVTTAGAVRLAKEAARQKVLDAIEQSHDKCTVDDLYKLVRKGLKFGTIYADPAWRYSNQATRAATDGEYPTMTVEEIAALPIRELAADQCHLHLWTTSAFLFECPKIFDAWGFTYKSGFVWVKPQMGIGNYWRLSHEYLLLGVRGDLTFLDRSLISWLSADRSKHSSKPHAIRCMIERASPPNRLELFGRDATEGWTVWGNEISRGIFDKDIRKL